LHAFGGSEFHRIERSLLKSGRLKSMLTIVGNVKNQVQRLSGPEMNIDLRMVSPLNGNSFRSVAASVEPPE